MAEITAKEKAAIAEVLIPVFSRSRSKQFSLPEDHEQLEREFRCDIVLRATDGELAKFEHTRPKGNVELERIRPQHGARVHDLLDAHMKSAGLKGVVVVLGLDPPPARSRDQEVVAGWLASFIVKKARRERLTYFNFDVIEDWEGWLNFVSKYVKKLVVAPGDDPEGDSGTIRSDSRVGHLVDSVGDFREALESKAKRYGSAASGNMLLVEFDNFPLEQRDLPEVKEAAAQTAHAFDEVWAVNFRQRKDCWRIWPPEDIEAPKERA